MANSGSITIVRPRSNAYVNICLFVSIEIKNILVAYSEVRCGLKIIRCQHVGRVATRKSFLFLSCEGSNAFISFSSFLLSNSFICII